MDLQTYKICRTHHQTQQQQSTNISSPPSTTKVDSMNNKKIKYVQVCDNTTMTDDKFNHYQNVGTISFTSNQQDQQPTPTSTTSSSVNSSQQQQPITNIPRKSTAYLQRTLSDSHCPDFINSREDLLAPYDNKNQFEPHRYHVDNPDVLGMEIYRTYSPPMLYSPTQNQQYLNKVCNCDLNYSLHQHRAATPGLKSSKELKFSSDQNIVHSTSQLLKDNFRGRLEHQHSYENQYSLDRKLVRHKSPTQFPTMPHPRFNTETKPETRMPRKSSLRKTSPTRQAPRNYFPCTKQPQEPKFPKHFERSQSYIIPKALEALEATKVADPFFIDRKPAQYNSLRRMAPTKKYMEDRVIDGAPASMTTEFMAGKGSDRYSVARSSTGSSRGGTLTTRGNLTSESELDDDPELIFDLHTAGAHMVDCQCACDRIGYSSSYHHLQVSGFFAHLFSNSYPKIYQPHLISSSQQKVQRKNIFFHRFFL